MFVSMKREKKHTELQGRKDGREEGEERKG
jgi:hypothetical protein